MCLCAIERQKLRKAKVGVKGMSIKVFSFIGDLKTGMWKQLKSDEKSKMKKRKIKDGRRQAQVDLGGGIVVRQGEGWGDVSNRYAIKSGETRSPLHRGLLA